MSSIQDKLIPVNLEKEMKRSFISYAMAVIIDRALPDVRDGLKPVHRRILYDMEELGMTPDKPYRKSARLVGDVLGKFHPHGDSSVYDAMVRLAQPFNIRYTLVDGQGNYGSVDGDGAAAMRYTEARMTKLTPYLLEGIEKDTVDFYPNFDETLMQPAVLPSRFPNLLVNGSSGIAVGMATNIPPHNLGEVIDGVICMIDNPDCTIDDLMQHIKGPDFPTGGIILGRRGIREAYYTGHGRIEVRAKTNIEEMPNGRSRIVVTEIPYQVNKAKLVEKIAELVHDKRIEGISDIRDESDRQGMRIVIMLLPLPHNIGTIAGLMVIGLGCAPIYPCVIHSTPAYFGEDKSQAIVGMQMACAYVGSMCMPPLFGLIAQHVSVNLFPFYLVVFLALMVAMHETLRRKCGDRAAA